jgi:FkbM family methyltransferase
MTLRAFLAKAPRLRAGLKTALRDFPVPVPKMVAGHCFLSHPLQLPWKPETHVLNWTAELLRSGDTFFDVGAHAGWISLVAARIVGPHGRVVAFEPSPALAGLIRYHKRMNRASAIRVEQTAITNAPGVNEFFLHNGGASSVNALSQDAVMREAPASSPIDKVLVRSRSLDEYCESSKRVPQVIKIDVEGAELDVLRGASRVLSQFKPGLILAVHPPLIANGSSNDVFELLQQHHYSICRSETTRVGDDLWGDYLCASR